jgi:hypothetical protein
MAGEPSPGNLIWITYEANVRTSYQGPLQRSQRVGLALGTKGDALRAAVV